MSELAIKSNRIITPQGIRKAFVVIKDGVITDVTDSLPKENIEEYFDAGDNVLMPGIIDPHVHINEPGRIEWEGFNSATMAALAGGITSLIDMPLNSSPVTTTSSAFEKKLASTRHQLHANCGFWGGIIPGNNKEIEPLIEKGVSGFKAFLTHSGIDEFPNVTEEDLHRAMPIIAKYNLPLLVHCELSDENFKINGDNTSYKNYLNSRPRKWEDDAISLMIRLCEKYNCKTHIVHLSSSNSIEQIDKAKQRGLPLTVETAQHYLYFSAEEINDGQTEFKCAPPIREKENNELLWQALKDGIIDFVATDHSPATAYLKQKEGDFSKAWGGVASIQFALPTLYTAARKRNGTLKDMVKWLCENPAKLIGKDKSKGKIEVGYDADLTIWNPEKSFQVKEDIILHKNKITPYMNEQLFGVVDQTFLSGIKVFDNGLFTHLNNGKIITR